MGGSGKSKAVDRGDPKVYFGAAGLPAKAAAAWIKAMFHPTGNFKRDAAVGTKFWREGTAFLAKLPKKCGARLRLALPWATLAASIKRPQSPLLKPMPRDGCKLTLWQLASSQL